MPTSKIDTGQEGQQPPDKRFKVFAYSDVAGTDSRSGDAIVENFFDDFYMVQVDVDLNGGSYADIWVRFIDINNGYRIRLTSDASDNLTLCKMVEGELTQLGDTATYTTAGTVAVKVKVYLDGSDERFKVWVDGTQEINTTDPTHAAGGVALSGDKARFDDVKIGYDNNADNDIDDTGDDIVVDDDLSGDSVSASHNHAGNMIDDGYFRFVYDAPALDSRRRRREPIVLVGSWRSGFQSPCDACGHS